MPSSVNVGGTWRSLSPFVNVNGAWHAAIGYVNVNGAWRQFSATAPVITSQPSNASVTTGGSATFSLTATGIPAPNYQWYESGVAISGATGASYTTPATTYADNGQTFQCVVSNIAGTVDSNTVSLAVSAPPVITSQPQNTSAQVGQSATFNIGATGPGLSYQWYTNGAPISGGTGTTLTVPNVTLGLNGEGYQCVVTNSYGSVPSNTGFLTVTSSYTNVNASGPGTVSGTAFNGESNTSPATATTTATVTANGGTGSYSYTWAYVSGKSITISGAATATATFTDTEHCNNQTQTSVYQCVVSDGTTSATVNVTVQLTFENGL